MDYCVCFFFCFSSKSRGLVVVIMDENVTRREDRLLKAGFAPLTIIIIREVHFLVLGISSKI